MRQKCPENLRDPGCPPDHPGGPSIRRPANVTDTDRNLVCFAWREGDLVFWRGHSDHHSPPHCRVNRVFEAARVVYDGVGSRGAVLDGSTWFLGAFESILPTAGPFRIGGTSSIGEDVFVVRHRGGFDQEFTAVEDGRTVAGVCGRRLLKTRATFQIFGPDLHRTALGTLNARITWTPECERPHCIAGWMPSPARCS